MGEMNLSSDAKIIAALESFGRIEEQTYRNISALDYLRESVVECREGTWEIFTKRDFVFPYFIRTVTTPVNKFVAVFSGNRKFLIYGSFDSIEDLNKHLVRFARGFLSKPGTFLGIPRRLMYDNAQDYGYLRGLAAGIILMAADLSYSSVFKLQNGILTGFIEFIKQVYYGDPPLAIGVGIAG